MDTAKKRRAPAWRKVFLEALRNTGNVTLAADTAGVHRGTAYNAKDDFAQQVGLAGPRLPPQEKERCRREA